jgi:hypothetical protein
MQHIPGSFDGSARRSRRALGSSILGFTLALVFGAAASASGQEPDHSAVQGPSPAGLPLKAVFAATSTVERDAARCPGGLKATVRGRGLSTQLGEFTTLQTHCLSPSTDPLAFTNGLYEWTARDGSTIRGHYGGRVIPTPTSSTDGQAYIDAAWSITEGTGRLQGARGGGAASGLLTLQTGGADVVLDGHIRIPKR